MQEKLELNQRVLFLTYYNGKPTWLVGQIKHIMAEVGHYTVLVRKDYRGLVEGNAQAVLPRDFIFANVEEADAFVKEIDQKLTKFVANYDSSPETWDEMTKALTWQPPVALPDAPLPALGESRPESDSVPSASPQ